MRFRATQPDGVGVARVYRSCATKRMGRRRERERGGGRAANSPGERREGAKAKKVDDDATQPRDSSVQPDYSLPFALPCAARWAP